MHLLDRRFVACVLAAFVGLAHGADGDGLTVDAESGFWPRLQGRLSIGAIPSASRSAPGAVPSAGGLSNLSLLGDYYLTGSMLGPKRSGGFRATSGVIVGGKAATGVASGVGTVSPSGLSADRRLFGASALQAADGSADSTATPYLGLGYTGLSVRGGWSFNADLGLVSQTRNGAVKLGRVVTGNQGLDDAVRDMRWSPLLQLGVSYSF
jgi:hypothetical protein